MDKRFAHHLTKKTRSLKLWYLLVLALVFGVLAVFGMRSNYAHMVSLRDQVYAADKAGVGVDEALQNLRNFVGHHMNTQLSSGDTSVYPPVQLKYTYDRLVRAKSQQTSDYNAQIYTKAQKYCEAKIPNYVIGKYRVQCIQQYVSSHNVEQISIDPSLYKFDFYSPRWSPDVAGLSMVLAVLSLLAFIAIAVARRLTGATTHS
jgi:hypothetical protein